MGNGNRSSAKCESSEADKRLKTVIGCNNGEIEDGHPVRMAALTAWKEKVGTVNDEGQ
jgi:hypothetical protein